MAKRFGGEMTLVFAGSKFEIVGNCELDTVGRTREPKATSTGLVYSTEEMTPGLLTVEILETVSGPDITSFYGLTDEPLTLIEKTAKRMHVCPAAEMTGGIKRDRKTGQVSGIAFAFRASDYQETPL